MKERVSLLLWRAGWPARQILLLPIRLYRISLGKLVGGRCRFYPSCSGYAEMAIKQAGAARGLVLVAWRILRCSPLSSGGIDHPPAGRLWSTREGSAEMPAPQGEPAVRAAEAAA